MSSERERQIAEEFKTAMLEAIEKFFENHIQLDDEPHESGVSDHGLQLATAILLIEMTRADFEIKSDERRAVTEAVGSACRLSRKETDAILGLAEKQIERSVPMYRFAQLIDRRFSMEQKKLLVQQMWRVAFSDAEILAHEEYLVRKLSGLIHVPLADFLEAKIKARDEFR